MGILAAPLSQQPEHGPVVAPLRGRQWLAREPVGEPVVVEPSELPGAEPVGGEADTQDVQDREERHLLPERWDFDRITRHRPSLPRLLLCRGRVDKGVRHFGRRRSFHPRRKRGEKAARAWLALQAEQGQRLITTPLVLRRPGEEAGSLGQSLDQR